MKLVQYFPFFLHVKCQYSYRNLELTLQWNPSFPVVCVCHCPDVPVSFGKEGKVQPIGSLEVPWSQEPPSWDSVFACVFSSEGVHF